MGDLTDGTIAAVIGAIAGGAAGYIATKFANSENRKATRVEARLDQIDANVEALRREIAAYWGNSVRDPSAESRILSLFEDLTSKIDNLAGFGVEDGAIAQGQNQTDRLYALATDSPFKSELWKSNPVLVEEVRKECAAICRTFHPARLR